jgi:hypothetical protein
VKIILAGPDGQSLRRNAYSLFSTAGLNVLAIVDTPEDLRNMAGSADLVVVEANIASSIDEAVSLLSSLGVPLAVILPAKWGGEKDRFSALPEIVSGHVAPTKWGEIAEKLSGKLADDLSSEMAEEAAQVVDEESEVRELSRCPDDGASSSIEEEAEVPVRLMNRSRPTVRVGFYGERGGVGVSTAALAMARALAESDKGQRVALFDATGRGDLHLMAGLNPGAEAVSNGGITFFLSAPTEERALGFDAVVIDGGRERGRFNAEWHSVSRPMDGDEILRLAGVEREGEEIEKEKEKKDKPSSKGGLLSNLRLGRLFSIEVTS